MIQSYVMHDNVWDSFIIYTWWHATSSITQNTPHLTKTSANLVISIQVSLQKNDENPRSLFGNIIVVVELHRAWVTILLCRHRNSRSSWCNVQEYYCATTSELKCFIRKCTAKTVLVFSVVCRIPSHVVVVSSCGHQSQPDDRNTPPPLLPTFNPKQYYQYAQNTQPE